MIGDMYFKYVWSFETFPSWFLEWLCFGGGESQCDLCPQEAYWLEGGTPGLLFIDIRGFLCSFGGNQCLVKEVCLVGVLNLRFHGGTLPRQAARSRAGETFWSNEVLKIMGRKSWPRL